MEHDRTTVENEIKIKEREKDKTKYNRTRKDRKKRIWCESKLIWIISINVKGMKKKVRTREINEINKEERKRKERKKEMKMKTKKYRRIRCSSNIIVMLCITKKQLRVHLHQKAYRFRGRNVRFPYKCVYFSRIEQGFTANSHQSGWFINIHDLYRGWVRLG